VHGDYKLDNVMIDAGDPARVSAVLDWEMCAIGDPLVDIGVLLAYWTAASAAGSEVVTSRPGWLTREGLIERYAKRSGRDLGAVRFYETFALFKIAVIVQQIYSRHVGGHTRDPRFAAFGERVGFVASRAAAMIA
jgi:aminoglycoside phosphotransferase (APT) family kinase protein